MANLSVEEPYALMWARTGLWEPWVGNDPVDATLTDADNPLAMSSLTVRITSIVNAGLEVLDANVFGTAIAKAYNPGTGVLSLTGNDSVANYQQVLRTVTYGNSSLNPTTIVRLITFVANDGGDSNTATTTLNTNVVNSGPVLDLDADDSVAPGVNFATTFTENNPPVLVADTDAILSDVDSATLASLTVTITNLQNGPDESLVANVAGTAITANYNTGTGVLSLTGADTPATTRRCCGPSPTTTLLRLPTRPIARSRLSPTTASSPASPRPQR